MEAPFIGREAELARLERLLASHSLVTLTGAGGYGKTRLAREAVRRFLRPQAGEFHLVALGDEAASGNPALSILASIGVRPDPGRDPLDTLAARLSVQTAWVVLDGCERSGPDLGKTVAEMLARCPRLQVLATSRRPLALDGEVVWRVPPMSAPDPAAELIIQAVLESDAARLFAAIASRHSPDFGLTAETAGLIARICAGLDGIPLAVELAASRVATQPLATIATAIAGGPDDGLRASLGWSYGLLSEEEQRLFRRLGVLAGAGAGDVAAICGAPSSRAVAAALSGLAELGLVEARTDPLLGEARYSMLGGVRAYAGELLVGSGEAEDAADLHLRHFAALAADAGRLLNDARGRHLLHLHAGNLGAAMDHAIAAGDPAALDMCEGLAYWWFAADRFEQGRSVCARALAANRGAEPARRALVKRCAALLAVAVERYPEAQELASEALALTEGAEDERALGLSLQAVNLVRGTVDPRGAAESGRRAVELLRGAGSEHDLSHALLTLAAAEALRDRFESFDGLRAELTSIPAARGDQWLLIMLDLYAAWARLMEGDPAGARGEAERVLRLIGEEVSTRAALAKAHRLHAIAWSGAAAEALERGLAETDAARAAGFETGALTVELATAAAELALGYLDAVEAKAEAGLSAPALHAAVFWREALARISLARGEPERAVEHAAAIRAAGERSESFRQAALADHLEGVAEIQRGELERASGLLHRALGTQGRHRCNRDAADSLEALGQLAERAGDPRRAIRLRAAGASARRALGCAHTFARREPAEGGAEAEHALDPEQVRRARAEGERLSLGEAIAYALRSRGRRERAMAGWASLTPAEAQAARLAAAGSSNPEIAARLFMSRSTVKTHLSRAYGKLGVANRVELAALSIPEQE